jgi:hypothetical protein
MRVMYILVGPDCCRSTNNIPKDIVLSGNLSDPKCGTRLPLQGQALPTSGSPGPHAGTGPQSIMQASHTPSVKAQDYLGPNGSFCP